LGRSATEKKDALILKFILGMKLHMFRTVPLSIIRSFSLYTQQWYMSYRFAYSLRAGLGWNAVESHSNNTFEKLVQLVGFIMRILTRCTVT
jgi:hypothetical protein